MKKLIVICLVVLCIVSFWRVSKLEPLQKNVDVARKAGWDALVGDCPKEVCNSLEPITLRANSMATTSLPGENLSCSFTFRHAMWPNMSGVNDYVFDELILTTPLNYFRITGTPSGGKYYWVVTGTLPDSYTLIADPPVSSDDIYWIEIPCKVEMIGETATRLTSSTQPIGEKQGTHSKENIITEEWFVPAGTTYHVTIGDQTFTHITEADYVTALSLIVSGNGLDCDDWSDFMVGTKYSMSIENIKFGAIDINTSTFNATTWGGTSASVDKLWVEGFGGDSIGFWCSEAFYNGAFVYNSYSGGTISAPLAYDFSNLVFKWMDDEEIDDSLEVYCTGLRTLNESGIDIGNWHGSIAELKALGQYVQKHGCYYWDSFEPDMSSTVELYLDLTSAEALGIEIRGPQPKIKIEGCGFSGGTKWVEGYVSPYDGQYSRYMMHNGEWMLTNGSAYLYLLEVDGEEWGLGPGPPSSPYYISVGGGPTGIFMVNTDSYNDSIIFEDIGQRQFSGLFGEGVGPAVSDSTAEAISLDIHLAIPSYQHNGTFIFDTWPLDAVSRTVAPHFTDVVNIAIDTSKNIYANAHTHEDWEGSAGVIGPDADGYFTMPAGGGSLTLTLKCNYRKRQSLVGGENEIPVPLCYWSRRHDSLLGQGATPEEAEAVWDWRGFYMTQSFQLPSVPANVTCTIRYYMDLDGVSDNHKTDSTRQTEYAYNPGELHTLTRTIPVTYADENGWSSILIDLFDEKNNLPIAMVYDIKFEFEEAGEYRMQAPALTQDPGDRQEVTTTDPFYREAPENVGMEIKVDESWRYAQGVWSGIRNGLYDRTLFMPDNIKGAVVEKTFPTLNVLIGAKTGQDLTTTFPLSGIPITNSGEAWIWTHNPSAEAAHMVDGEGNSLKTLVASDIAPGMHLGPADQFTTIYPPVAVRCFRFNAVNGIPYKFYGTYVADGQAHGMMVTKDAYEKTGEAFPRQRSGATGKLYRRHLGSMEDTYYEFASNGFSANIHSYWKSSHQPVLDDDAERSVFEYAILQGGEYKSLGRFATREFAALITFIESGGDLCVIEHFRNAIYVFKYQSDTGITHIYSSDAGQWYIDNKAKVGYTLPKTDVEPANTDGSVSGYVDANGRIVLFHVKSNNLKKLISTDFGASWGTEATMISGQNISKSFVISESGIQFCFAVDTSGAFKVYRSKDNFVDTTWTENTNYFSIDTGVSQTQPSAYFSHGVLWAYCVKDDTEKCYKSVDQGQTWTEVVST